MLWTECPGAQAENQIPNPLGGSIQQKTPAAFCRGDPNSLAALLKRPQSVFQIGVVYIIANRHHFSIVDLENVSWKYGGCWWVLQGSNLRHRP